MDGWIYFFKFSLGIRRKATKVIPGHREKTEMDPLNSEMTLEERYHQYEGMKAKERHEKNFNDWALCHPEYVPFDLKLEGVKSAWIDGMDPPNTLVYRAERVGTNGFTTYTFWKVLPRHDEKFTQTFF